MAITSDYIISLGEGVRYYVEEMLTGTVVFSSLSINQAVAESQRRNGYEPVDGNVMTYGLQIGEYTRRRATK